MNTITFHYTPGAGDYVRGMWAQLMRRPSMILWLAISAPMSLCLLCFLLGYIPFALLRSGSTFTLSYALPLVVALIPLAMPWLIYFVVMPLNLRSRVKSNERLRCETFCQVDEQGLVIRNRFAETKMDWGTFAIFFETKGLILLPHSVNERMYQIIPKRGFESPSAEAAFRELLQRKVRSSEIARGATLAKWIVRLILILLVIAVPLTMILLVIAYVVAAFIRTSH
jgi:hypothetical protein